MHSWYCGYNSGQTWSALGLWLTLPHFWVEFKLLFLAVKEFEMSLCEGGSAVLSGRISF